MALSGNDTISTWLDDPVGGAILRELLVKAGQSPEALTPIHGLPLAQLVTMSQGAFTKGMLDDLVRQAGGDPDADRAAAAAVPAAGTWQERIVPGRFAGKTVIVTGAGSGIGRATASRVAREGGRVVAVDVSQERLDAFAAEHPEDGVVALTADITDDAGVARIVEAAGERIDGSRTSPGSWTT